MKSVRYDRLSALDASFLYAETEHAPLAVGLFATLEDGAISEESLRHHVASRLPACPRLHKKLQFVALEQGRPVWVDDPHFAVARHVEAAPFPAPIDDDAAHAYMASFMQRPLGRELPLWQMRTFPMTRERTGLVLKLHHALLDGVSAAQLVLALFDMAPVCAPRAVQPFVPAPPPSEAALLADSLEEQSERLGAWWQELRRFRPSTTSLKALGDRLTNMLGLAVEHGLPYLPSAARASLSHRVGPERRFETITIPLARLKRIKDREAATVNDVALTLVAEGVSRVLWSRGDVAEHAIVKSAVPVSMRQASAAPAYGNQISMMVADLPVGDMPAVERLARVHAHVEALKQSGQANGGDLLTHLADDVPPLMVSLLARGLTFQSLIDVIVTNVPGPPIPLYMLGSRLLAAYPFVPLFGSTPLGVAITSYDGQLLLGVHADQRGLPELQHFIDGVHLALRQLEPATAERLPHAHP